MKCVLGCVLMCVTALGLLSGCASVSPMSDKTAFEIIGENETAITTANGIASIGVCSSRTVHLALDRAQNRGRKQLASSVAAKVAAVKKLFSEEVEPEDTAELDALFAAAGERLSHQIMRLSSPEDLQHETRDNLTTAWALMVVEPKAIADALANHANTAPHLYTRFLASQAYSALLDEMKAFDAFKAERGGKIIAR